MGRQRISMSPAARDAARVLGQQVRFARHERRWTIAELAARSGVSAGTVTSVEAGAPTVSVGNALNVAVASGVPLFSITPEELARMRRSGQERISLLPGRVDHPRGAGDGVNLDF